MTLNQDRLTIHVGDTVTFDGFTQDSDNAQLTGKVKGTVRADELTLLVVVNEFTMCTVAARCVNRVNNLFINLNNMKDNLRIDAAL